VHAESQITTIDNDTLIESITLLNAKLKKLEEERLTSPIKSDPSFSNHFIETLLVRAQAELDALYTMDSTTTGGGAGFIPLFRLAPRRYKKGRSVGISMNYAAMNENDRGINVDILVKSLNTLSCISNWNARATLFVTIDEARIEEELEEKRDEQQLLKMDSEDFILLWTNYILGYIPEEDTIAIPTSNTPTNLATPIIENERVIPPSMMPIEALISSTPGILLNGKLNDDKIHKRLKDFSTDLRDSAMYMQILTVLGPELPMHKAEKSVRRSAISGGMQRWRDETCSMRRHLCLTEFSPLCLSPPRVLSARAVRLAFEG
jgi:hypothetical protein